MNAAHYWNSSLRIGIVFVAALLSSAYGQGDTNGWSLDILTPATNFPPAYSPNQLAIIKENLNKWKAPEESSGVKDLLRGQPRWQFGTHDEWNYAPDSFQDEKEARKAGCQFDSVKSPDKKNALLKITYIHQAWIFVYDEDSFGRYIKTGVIVPPTWFSYAAVTFVDVLGPKQPKFILIEHNGDIATGHDEKVHWLVGWRDGAFHTAFRETVYMRTSEPGEETRYRMNYRIVKDSGIRIEAQCIYDRVLANSNPYDFHSNWRDWYFWNDKTFSFYDPNSIAERIRLGTDAGMDFNVRLTLETNRLKILSLPPLLPKMTEMDAYEYWKGIGM